MTAASSRSSTATSVPLERPDRARRFVFDSVVDDYVRGRPDMPLEAVRAAAAELALPGGARVLEIGAGAGQLTVGLVEAGFRVVALEPGDALRARAAERVPAAELVGLPFEDFEPEGRFDALFSSNAFHWVDPDVAYSKASEVADALVLVWNLPFIADGDLHRRLQEGVMAPRGSTFPTTEAGVRELFERELAGMRAEIVASSRFLEPWSATFERRLEYTPDRYTSLLRSMSYIASLPEDESAALAKDVHSVLGSEPFTVADLVWVLAARSV